MDSTAKRLWQSFAPRKRLSPKRIFHPTRSRACAKTREVRPETQSCDDAPLAWRCILWSPAVSTGSRRKLRSRLATQNHRNRGSVPSTSDSRRFSSFTHSACVVVRPNRASKCTWSSTPPMSMGGQSSSLEMAPRYEWSASRVGLSRRNGRRSLVEKTR